MNGTYTPDMTMGKECGSKFLKNLVPSLVKTSHVCFRRLAL